MFVSDDDLKLTYGVDLRIGKYLVDRKVPAGNLYWKDRYLYIPPMTGYLFIPVYMDLQYRLGISREELLSEEHLVFIETVLHSAAKQEFSLITQEEHIKECIEVSRRSGNNESFLQELEYYFSGNRGRLSYWPGNKLQALNRGDAYLFTLCFFDTTPDRRSSMAKAWRSFIDYYLVQDDLEDLEKDYKSGDENSLLEAGIHRAAETMKSILQNSYEQLNPLNPVLGNRIDYEISKTKIDATIETFIKKNAL